MDGLKNDDDPYNRYKKIIEHHFKQLRDPEKEGKFDSDDRPFPINTSSLFPRDEDDDEKYLEELMVCHNVHFPKDDPFRYKKIIDYHWKHIMGPDWSFFSGVFASGPVKTPPFSSKSVPEGPQLPFEARANNDDDDPLENKQETPERLSG